MSVLTQLLMSIIYDNIWTTITSLLMALVIYKLAKFYYRYYYCLPPGPFPLPIIGNLLSFRFKQFWETSLRNIAKNNGPVFTLHLGNTPYIIITDVDIGRQTFGKQNFLGRPDSFLGTFFKNDIIFADYSQHWEVLRRVALSAVQKYSVNERLVNVAVDCVDKMVQTMLEREGPNKPIDPFNYLYLTYLNIMATSCFSQYYNIDDQEFKQIKYGFKDFSLEIGSRSFLWESSQIIRWFDRKFIQRYKKIIKDLQQLMKDKYLIHLNDYDSGIERDFCDALIAAKNDAIREAKHTAAYLTDDNLVMAVFDLFIAGTDSSYIVFLWSLLLLAYYPDVQQKLRKEIESIIGDRIPTHDDRQRCHYVMAFMAETLRYKNPGPTGFFHKAMTTGKIGDYTIPEGMAVFVYQGFILLDDKNFENPDTFKPERFIDSDGHYMTTRSPAFIPFSVGRRSCVGEKLAIAEFFLVFVRFLQLTQNYDIVLDSHHGLDGDYNSTLLVNPQ
ncbi:cytochrome P450 2C31-like, partial [Oppia nitens]|uniref:cytochrome P450 2C31-like n=1 Tax=Oppia nitens TaxID=1686743 RepID=UPI0023DCA59B